jgi:cytidine deaminase
MRPLAHPLLNPSVMGNSEAVVAVDGRHHPASPLSRQGRCLRWMPLSRSSVRSRPWNRTTSARVDACRSLIRDTFPDDDHHGAAAMLLDDGTIITGAAPEAINSSVQVCHETEPFCAAFRLGRRVVASVCLHREPGGWTLVLSPCGVCTERLASHGPDVLVAVADPHDPTQVAWKSLKGVLPNYWMTAFPDEIDAAWSE